MVDSLSKNDKFTYQSLCSTCTESCCHSVDCPPVFPNDLKKLAQIGKDNSDYIQILKVTDTKQLMQIKRKPNTNECIFFDREKNCCGIYEHRPLDCKLYPFDIDVIDGEPWWVVHSCNPNSDWTWTESYLEKFESNPEICQILELADVYQAYLELGFDDRSKSRTRIRKVKISKQIMELSIKKR